MYTYLTRFMAYPRTETLTDTTERPSHFAVRFHTSKGTLYQMRSITLQDTLYHKNLLTVIIGPFS